mgnify:CR=1 FL=1
MTRNGKWRFIHADTSGKVVDSLASLRTAKPALKGSKLTSFLSSTQDTGTQMSTSTMTANPKSPRFDKPTGIDFNRNADGVIEKIFSEDERKFIWNKIIPKFTLEKQIIDDIVTKIKKDGKVKAEVLDDVVEDSVIEWRKNNQDIAEKQKIDEKNKDVYRIATMGRLAEIGIVNWEIEEGISWYSINK